MTSLAPVHLAYRSSAKVGILALLFLSGPCLASAVYAQVGNDNPAGASGAFNGLAGGCGYDPYTANATRSITDIAVAGAVGDYPLALVRTANSRAPSTTEVFGWSGGWNHNYNWILQNSPSSNQANFQPTRYTVDFPDGRVETFKAVTWDPGYYRVRPGADTPAAGSSAGLRERLQPNPVGGGSAYLILPDGGKIQFQAVEHTVNGTYYYKYTATAIIDPHGLVTNLAWETTANGTRRLVSVTEPAGRYLNFSYTGTNSPRIASVAASDGRTVQYYYVWCNSCSLDHVVYFGNSNWTAHYQYCNANVAGDNLPFLLLAADDPMYAGPMKRIAYDYKPATPNNADGTAPVYGQILHERYWDGVSQPGSGAIVSTLAVGLPNNNPVYRTETRGNGATRSFVYNGAGVAGYLSWVSDFIGYEAQQHYDSNTKYIDYVVDRNGNRTDYTSDPITGNVTQIKYPLTQGDTPGQTLRPTVNYTYTNSYYLHTIVDEGSNTTTIDHDANNRVSQITYPDQAYETFTPYNAFGQVLTHRMTTGGTETFTYDGQYRLQYYSDPYHNNTNNPSIHYFYEGHNWVNGIYDAGGNPYNWTYNDRGQVLVTTLPPDPFDNNARHHVTNVYNPDGTLQSGTNELGYLTTYTYDDYRRLASVTPPERGDGTGTHTTYYIYADGAPRGFYTDTTAQPSYVLQPSGKMLRTVYDANWRKSSVTVGYESGDDATTSYLYDGVGNASWVTNPRSINTQIVHDERNRPSEIHDAYGNVTYFKYDTAGRGNKITRPNGQTITYDTFDAMNRVTQQTATQSPEPNAVTKYAYYTTADGQTAPVGLLKTMTDPHNTSEVYKYTYDLLGRKTGVTYPRPTPGAQQTSEGFSYDAAGRLHTFTNRDSKTETFSYDALNRMTGFTWNDSNPHTPDVSFGYDAASRLITINNANANITRYYYNDNLLWGETEAITGGTSKTMSYGYDEDGNRASTVYPDSTTFTYDYTGRNQLHDILSNNLTVASYGYNVNGDMTGRSFRVGASSTYAYDSLDRVTNITHSFNRDTRTLDYGYDSVGNRKWTKRDGGNGDVFRYDLADQATAVKLNIAHPDTTPTPTPNIVYDANGNRTTFSASGPTDTYVTNNLNQYTSRNNINAQYDPKGNLIQGFDGSAYTYDGQNRLLGAPGMSFTYDGLNRQVSRTVNGGITTYSVWDGWDLVQEYHMSGNSVIVDASYLYGPSGLVKNLTSGNCYFQDGSGSTSHLSDSTGILKEWYRYDLQGTPTICDANNNQRTASAYSVRHLFTGQQWYKEIGLYDLRNRFYSPDIGRFLQADPIRFRGDPTNLYRYCGNNPVTRWDPVGWDPPGTVVVNGDPTEGNDLGDPVTGDISSIGFLPGDFGWPGTPFALEPYINAQLFGSREIPGVEFHFPESPSVQHPAPSSVPAQNPQPSLDPSHPTTTAEFIAAGNMIEHGNTMDTTPAFDMVDLFSSGIAGLARSSIRSLATETAATGFRYVSEGEAQIIRKTAQIPMVDRFGNAKNIFYTNDSFTSAAEAQRALSLPSTPAFRIEFNLGNAPAGYGGIADPLFGQPGGGAEFILREGAEPIPVTLIVPLGE